jgi:hypothetical protein
MGKILLRVATPLIRPLFHNRKDGLIGLGIGLWCLKPLSTIFQRSVLLVEQTRVTLLPWQSRPWWPHGGLIRGGTTVINLLGSYRYFMVISGIYYTTKPYPHKIPQKNIFRKCRTKCNSWCLPILRGYFRHLPPLNLFPMTHPRTTKYRSVIE